MRILAIDPGTTESAWCELVDGKPVNTSKETNEEVLRQLRTLQTAPLIGVPLCIEMVASYGMPVGREVFETVVWIGRFYEAWAARGGEVRLIYRKDVKMHLCHSTRANDASIRQALIDKFGGKEKAIGRKATPGPLYGIHGDGWSALAIALTASVA